jgi:hypothetical protein
LLQIAERFELLYDSVDDIDFFIAGISERKVKGATMGPTFQCIVADQFLRLNRGDRFFYDLAEQTGSFSEGMTVNVHRFQRGTSFLNFFESRTIERNSQNQFRPTYLRQQQRIALAALNL